MLRERVSMLNVFLKQAGLSSVSEFQNQINELTKLPSVFQAVLKLKLPLNV